MFRNWEIKDIIIMIIGLGVIVFMMFGSSNVNGGNIIHGGNVTHGSNIQLDVYTLMLKTNNLTIDDIKEIHSKTIIGSGNGNYIEYQEIPFQLVKIVINRKNDNEVRYTLLHEIGHYVDKKYNKQIPLTATNNYSKVSQDELYAESFSQLYY